MRKSALFLLILALLLGTACAHARATGPSDKQIADDVRHAITDTVPGASFITVTVDKGIVTLNGQVASETERRKIGDAANDVKGVRTVINNITLP